MRNIEEGVDYILYDIKSMKFENQELCITGYQDGLFNSALINSENGLNLIIQGFDKGKDVILKVPIENQYKSQSIIESRNPDAINSTELLSVDEDIAFIKTSSTRDPPSIYLCRLKDKIKCTKIDKIHFHYNERSTTSQFIENVLKSIKIDTFETPKGAEGYFMRSYDPVDNAQLFASNKRPLILMIHGGPHAISQKDTFLKSRALWLSLGYNLCIVNYRGSIGYGIDKLNELPGNVFNIDVEDTLGLFNHCIDKFNAELECSKLGINNQIIFLGL